MTDYLGEPNLQNKLVAHLVFDNQLLKQVGGYLQAEDFKPHNGSGGEGWARWVIASLSLEYWNSYHHPVSDLLTSELQRFAKHNPVSERQRDWLKDYLHRLKEITLEAGDVITERVTEYKKERARLEAVEKILDLQSSGQLTDEVMLDICRGVVDQHKNGNGDKWDEFFTEKEALARVERRRYRGDNYPCLLIDPLDRKIKMIGPGELGLWVAPYKRGKSLALIHTSVAYTIQGLNVLHITCEDPKEVVEDRIDAMVAQIPIRELGEREEDVLARGENFRRILQGHLWVKDATEGQCSIPWMDGVMQEAREKGFFIHAVSVDYDDEIKAPKDYEGDHGSRRFEFADIYRGLRQFSAKWGVMLWTAAQTQRDTENLRIISGDRIAEDISKMRKVTLAIGIGNGTELDKRAHYLWVAVHKNDRKYLGTYIIHNEEQGIFYDRFATRKLLQKLKAQQGG